MNLDPHPEKSMDEQNAAGLLRLVTFASVAAACLLIMVKLVAYLNTGAMSILASLLDSSMDAAASIINLIAVRYALTPADSNHRFGHGKAESLAALCQALFILGSFVFLVHEAAHRLLAPQAIADIGSGMLTMLFAMAITGSLVVLQAYVVRRTKSPAVHADSVHYRADLMSNAATLAALYFAGEGITLADPLFALLIAGYLLFSTREILRQAMNELLDRELPNAQRQAITSRVLAHPEVRGLHDMRTRQSGRTPIIQLHLEMDADISLKEAHRIADEVELMILDRLPNADIVVHQDPVGIKEVQHWQATD